MNIKNFPAYFQLIFGVKANEKLRFRLVTKLAKRLVPTYKFTWSELAWFHNPRLNDVLSRFDEREGFNAHRRLALQQLLRLTSNIPGDTAECGVYKGCGSYIILQANKRSSLSRVHHIFDSFSGLSNPSEKDGEYWTVNDLSMDENLVKKNLSEFCNVKFYKGWIPTRFNDVDGCTFSFVHVDVDLYEPTMESIRFFYGRLNTGGIFVCDDYGFLTCPGATAAIDEFLLSKPEKMVSLPGGGGFFIKGCVTSAE
jgi:O-methyltransferase